MVQKCTNPNCLSNPSACVDFEKPDKCLKEGDCDWKETDKNMEVKI